MNDVVPLIANYAKNAYSTPVHTCSRNRTLCIRKQATLLPVSITKSPVSGYKVSCFGNKCGQAFIGYYIGPTMAC